MSRLQEVDVRAGFVAMLERDPNDELARGMYADWLADHGLDSEQIVRNPHNQKTLPNEQRLVTVWGWGTQLGKIAADMMMVPKASRAHMQYIVELKALRSHWLAPLRWVLAKVHYMQSRAPFFEISDQTGIARDKSQLHHEQICD